MQRVLSTLDKLEQALHKVQARKGAVTRSDFDAVFGRFGALSDHTDQLALRFAEAGTGGRLIQYTAMIRWLRTQAGEDEQPRAARPAVAHTTTTTTTTCALGCSPGPSRAEAGGRAGYASQCDAEAEDKPGEATSCGTASPHPCQVRQGMTWLSVALARARSSHTRRSRSQASCDAHSDASTGCSARACHGQTASSAERNTTENVLVSTAEGEGEGDAFYSDVTDTQTDAGAGAVESGVGGSGLRGFFEKIDVAGHGILSLAHVTHILKRRGVPVRFHDMMEAANAAGICRRSPAVVEADRAAAVPPDDSCTAFTTLSAADFALVCAYLPQDVVRALDHLVHARADDSGNASEALGSRGGCSPARTFSPQPRGADLGSPSRLSTSAWLDVTVSPNTPTPTAVRLPAVAPSRSTSPLEDTAHAAHARASPRPSSPRGRTRLAERLHALDVISRLHRARSDDFALALPLRPSSSLSPSWSVSRSPSRANQCSMRRRSRGAAHQTSGHSTETTVLDAAWRVEPGIFGGSGSSRSVSSGVEVEVAGLSMSPSSRSERVAGAPATTRARLVTDLGPPCTAVWPALPVFHISLAGGDVR